MTLVHKPTLYLDDIPANKLFFRWSASSPIFSIMRFSPFFSTHILTLEISKHSFIFAGLFVLNNVGGKQSTLTPTISIFFCRNGDRANYTKYSSICLHVRILTIYCRGAGVYFKHGPSWDAECSEGWMSSPFCMSWDKTPEKRSVLTVSLPA